MTSFRGYSTRTVEVRVAGRVFDLLAPSEPEALLDDPVVRARFAADEYLPYWATLWPAARILAAEVAEWPIIDPAEPGRPAVLELGCGLGLVGLVAAARGYPVTLSDYDDDALAFAIENARRNGLPPPATRSIDWRRRFPGLRLGYVLGADLLYERRNLIPLARFVRAHLAPHGAALLADADRSTADEFSAVARDSGLTVAVRRRKCADANGPPACGRIFELRL